MGKKSTADRYGSVPVTIHWLVVGLIIVLLASGIWSAKFAPEELRIILLRIHAPIGDLVLLLMLFRLYWWWKVDRKPNPIAGMPKVQELASVAVHWLFYLVLILMAASGMGTIIASGAIPVLFQGVGDQLPDFFEVPPRMVHGILARVLLALIVLHVAGALYHQFIIKDGLIRRMWYSRKGQPAKPADPS